MLGYFLEIVSDEIFRLLLMEGCTAITLLSLIMESPLPGTSNVVPSTNSVKIWSLGIKLLSSNFDAAGLNCNKLLLVPTYKMPFGSLATEIGLASIPFWESKIVNGELSSNFEIPISNASHTLPLESRYSE